MSNKALEPTAVGAFIMTITDNITSPTSVTPLSAAVAQLGSLGHETPHETKRLFRIWMLFCFWSLVVRLSKASYQILPFPIRQQSHNARTAWRQISWCSLDYFGSWCLDFIFDEAMRVMTILWPNKSLQPTPGGAGSSAFAGYATGPAWLSSGR
jgi:hypothetical protein